MNENMGRMSKKDILYPLRRMHGYMHEIQKKYKLKIIDKPTIEEIMLFYVKGEKE